MFYIIKKYGRAPEKGIFLMSLRLNAVFLCNSFSFVLFYKSVLSLADSAYGQNMDTARSLALSLFLYRLFSPMPLNIRSFLWFTCLRINIVIDWKKKKRLTYQTGERVVCSNYPLVTCGMHVECILCRQLQYPILSIACSPNFLCFI